MPDYLSALQPNDGNLAELRTKIYRTLLSFKTVKSLDIEALTQEILVEAWQNKTPVTYQFIKHRMINAYNANKSYRRAVDASVDVPPPVSLSDAEKESQLDKLNRVMQAADLTPIQFQAVGLMFYLGHTYASAAAQLRWSEPRFKTVLTSALEQLRKAGRQVEAEDDAARRRR